MQRVRLVPHDPRWADAFGRESVAVARALGERLTAIHHIGSTAIPGISAKPIIDMLAAVDDVALVDERNSELVSLGYEPMGEFGIPGRRYFRKDDARGERAHHLHVFGSDSPQVARHLAFRDFLRARPDWAARYDALKRRLAERHPDDVPAYTDGKDEFVAEVDARAAAWRETG